MVDSKGLLFNTNLSTARGLTLYSWMDGDVLVLGAAGTGIIVAEIAQQLAWLGAALRHSIDDGLNYSEAYVRLVEGRRLLSRSLST